MSLTADTMALRDRDIAVHAGDDARLVATLTGFAEQLMEKVALRAQNAGAPLPAQAGVLRPMI
ncbi:hypothetical protein ROG8370_02237 [Roseovarius gaetbuli]|uniref:Uncharacterized protein n=1 Tax=Roseovarius gaetbuli TaxID=1356575 RepID=A0A1X6ZGD1_9RHOB|nr:hypothetical protein ROG8370_02237 [Roseovarius gaetbuli]